MDSTDVELRPAREDDLWIFERQASDPDGAGVFNWSGYRNLAATKRRLREDGFLGADDGCLIVSCGIEVVGTVVWKKVTYGTPSWSCWNIGISLLPEHRHKGIGTISQAALVAYLFNNTLVQRIEAFTDIENVAEQRALEKINFTREGVLRSTQFREGRWRDLYMYSILRSEYQR